MKKTQRNLSLFLIGVLSVYILFIFVFTAVYQSKQGSQPQLIIIMLLGGLGLGLGGILWRQAGKEFKKKGRKAMKLSFGWQVAILALVAFLPRLILILTTEIPQTSDYNYYYTTALRFIQESPFEPGDYMVAIAPNTLSFISFLGVIFRLFGSGVFVALLFNVIFTTGSVLLLFLCGRKVMKSLYAFIAALLSALSPTTFFYSLYLAIEPLALFTFLLGLWLFLTAYQQQKTGKQILFALLGGVVLAYSNEVRSNAIALLFALVVFTLLFSPEKKKNRFILAGVLLLAFFAFKIGYSFYQQQVFQTKIGITFGWALYEGMDISTFGGWSAENSETAGAVLAAYPPNQVQEVMLHMALERIGTYDLKQWFTLLAGKGMNLWTSNTYAAASFFEQGLAPWIEKLQPHIFNLLNIPYWLLMGSFIFSSFRYVLKKGDENSGVTVMFTFTLLALIIAHSFITSIPRYHYGMVPFILLLTFLMIDTKPKGERL